MAEEDVHVDAYDMLRDNTPFDRELDDDIFMTGPISAAPEHEGNSNQTDFLDDVFGSAPSSPVLTGGDDASHHLGQTRRPAASEHSDVPRLRSTHVTNGYREGIAVSKEKHMQDGFDEGYAVGAELGLRAGKCIGVLEGLQQALRARQAKVGVHDDTMARQQQLDEVANMLATAERELDMQCLFGKEFFGSDGVWTYEVLGEGEDEVLFEQVAVAHPIVKKWDVLIAQLAKKTSLSLR